MWANGSPSNESGSTTVAAATAIVVIVSKAYRGGVQSLANRACAFSSVFYVSSERLVNGSLSAFQLNHPRKSTPIR
jgi:hypothetical protein